MARKNNRTDDVQLAHVREVQEMRRSNAATAVRNRTRYRRADAERGWRREARAEA
jgi:hypothetical protein